MEARIDATQKNMFLLMKNLLSSEATTSPHSTETLMTGPGVASTFIPHATLLPNPLMKQFASQTPDFPCQAAIIYWQHSGIAVVSLTSADIRMLFLKFDVEEYVICGLLPATDETGKTT